MSVLATYIPHSLNSYKEKARDIFFMIVYTQINFHVPLLYTPFVSLEGA